MAATALVRGLWLVAPGFNYTMSLTVSILLYFGVDLAAWDPAWCVI